MVTSGAKNASGRMAYCLRQPIFFSAILLAVSTPSAASGTAPKGGKGTNELATATSTPAPTTSNQTFARRTMSYTPAPRPQPEQANTKKDTVNLFTTRSSTTTMPAHLSTSGLKTAEQPEEVTQGLCVCKWSMCPSGSLCVGSSLETS